MESNIVTVKNLPQVEEIFPGNLILIEDQLGTKTIDFKDFVIGPSNTSFYNAIVTNIRSISTFSMALSSTIEKNTNQTISKVDTRFLQLTAEFARINPLWYIAQYIMVIPATQRIGTRNFTVPLPNLSINDFNIRPSTLDTVSPIKTYLYRLERNLSIQTDENTFAYTLSVTANTNCTTEEQHTAKLVKEYYV